MIKILFAKTKIVLYTDVMEKRFLFFRYLNSIKEKICTSILKQVYFCF